MNFLINLFLPLAVLAFLNVCIYRNMPRLITTSTASKSKRASSTAVAAAAAAGGGGQKQVNFLHNCNCPKYKVNHFLANRKLGIISTVKSRFKESKCADGDH